MARVRPGSGMPGLWTPPPARVMGDRLLKAKQAEQRIRDAEAKAKAEIAQQAEEEKADLREKVEEVEERFDRLVGDLPKMMPASGGGKRTIKKVLERDFDIETGFAGEVVKHTAQTLTSGQRSQARTNIGAQAIAPTTDAAIELLAVPDDVDAFRTDGYAALGDTRSGVWVPAAGDVEPSHPGKRQDAAERWWELLSDVANVAHFGAIEGQNGGANAAANETAFALAKQYADHFGIHVFMPAGHWELNRAPTLVATSGTLRGAGREVTFLHWNDGTEAGQPFPAAEDRNNLFQRPYSGTSIDHLTFRDFTLVGNREANPICLRTDPRIFGILIYEVDRIKFDNVGFEDIRDSAVELRLCGSVEVTGCYAERIAKAGFNASACKSVRIIGNRIKGTGDDAIAAHSIPTLGGHIADRVVIQGNVIEDAYAIQCVGIHNGTIAGNVIVRPKYHGISVIYFVDGTGAYEGATSQLALNVIGNTITDVLNAYGAYTPAANGARYIRIINIPRQDGGLASIPGAPVVGTGAFTDYYLGLHNTQDTDPQAGGFAINVVGNVCARTLPSGVAYSDWGYGEMFTPDGFVDPDIIEPLSSGVLVNTASIGVAHGLQIDGFIRGLNVCDNVFSGMAACIRGAEGNLCLVASRISRNMFERFTDGIYMTADAGEVNFDLDITDNRFDGDPGFTISGHNSDGSWTAETLCYGIRTSGPRGMRIRRNVVSRVSRFLSIGTDFNQWSQNTLRLQPASIGFSTSNKGIGYVSQPAGDVWLYEFVYSDPTQSNYDTVIGKCPESAAAKPTSGYCLAGQIVHFTGAGTSGGTRTIHYVAQTTGAIAGDGSSFYAVTASTA